MRDIKEAFARLSNIDTWTYIGFFFGAIFGYFMTEKDYNAAFATAFSLIVLWMFATERIVPGYIAREREQRAAMREKEELHD